MANGEGGKGKEVVGPLKHRELDCGYGVSNPNLHETPDNGPDGDDGNVGIDLVDIE